MNFNILHRNHFDDILVKDVTVLCHYLKSLPEAKVKRLRSIAFRKEISKQPSTGSALWFIFVLINHSKLRKEVYKMYGSSIEGAPRTKQTKQTSQPGLVLY